MEAKYNIPGYVLATPNQPAKASYYYMLHALKTQHPKVFIFETFKVNDSGKGEEADSVIAEATESLPFSWLKLRMIDAMTQGKKNKLPYFLTLFKYHDRWKDLDEGDFSFRRKAMQDEFRGYVYLTQTTALDPVSYTEAPQIQTIDEEDRYYLQKMIDLAKKENIQLILFYAPFPMDVARYNLCYTMADFAQKEGLPFINGYELMQQGLFDCKTDFYDRDHLNANGAGRMTDYLAQYLQQHGFLN